MFVKSGVAQLVSIVTCEGVLVHWISFWGEIAQVLFCSLLHKHTSIFLISPDRFGPEQMKALVPDPMLEGVGGTFNSGWSHQMGLKISLSPDWSY